VVLQQQLQLQQRQQHQSIPVHLASSLDHSLAMTLDSEASVDTEPKETSDSRSYRYSCYGNSRGPENLDCRLRSVLSHHLGLPLVYALRGEDPSTMEYLRQESQFVSDESKCLYANILQDAVNEWSKDPTPGSAVDLTRKLSEKINEAVGLGFTSIAEAIFIPRYGWYAYGRMDMAFVPRSMDKPHAAKTSPLLFLELGLSGRNWWKKLDQAVGCLTRLCMFNESNFSFERLTSVQ
jgi:hypothetical protein